MESILVVEDEPTYKTVLCTILKQAGYTVDEASDGIEALGKLQKQNNYALVVSDRNMPNMDGLSLFQNMQKDSKLKNIPFIMQTGADSPAEVEDGIKAGLYYYLIKPYEEETILTLVKAALRDKKQQNVFADRIKKNQEALGTFAKGEFYIKTPKEAQNVAFLLGSLFPRPETAVSGLYELILNSIEHGNLGIGFDLKAKLIAESKWKDEVIKRLSLPDNKDKHVKVEFEQNKEKIEITLTDQGQGFNPEPYMEIEPSRATQGNGRGIAKANLLSFDEVNYQGNGNQVRIATIKS